MREGITVAASAEDRARLEATATDRNDRQKHACGARIILVTADRCGTVEITRRTGKPKPCVQRRQARLMAEGVADLLRGKIRMPSRDVPRSRQCSAFLPFLAPRKVGQKALEEG